MNERIQTLAGQALDKAVPQTWTTLTAHDLDKFTEVFAELFVQECCEVAHCNFHVDGLTLGTILKEHFGVE